MISSVSPKSLYNMSLNVVLSIFPFFALFSNIPNKLLTSSPETETQLEQNFKNKIIKNPFCYNITMKYTNSTKCELWVKLFDINI